jgi:hypothetical protein
MPRSLQEVLDHAEELADHFEDNPPDPADMVDATTLHELRDAVIDRAKAEEVIVAAVDAARAAGHTWPRIGAILGTSGEAARQRYGQARATRSSSSSAGSQKQSGKSTGRFVKQAKTGRVTTKSETSKRARRS